MNCAYYEKFNIMTIFCNDFMHCTYINSQVNF